MQDVDLMWIPLKNDISEVVKTASGAQRRIFAEISIDTISIDRSKKLPFSGYRMERLGKSREASLMKCVKTESS
jgi:hypothetical protein